jgi:hypothetical protein
MGCGDPIDPNAAGFQYFADETIKGNIEPEGEEIRLILMESHYGANIKRDRYYSEIKTYEFKNEMIEVVIDKQKKMINNGYPEGGLPLTVHTEWRTENSYKKKGLFSKEKIAVPTRVKYLIPDVKEITFDGKDAEGNVIKDSDKLTGEFGSIAYYIKKKSEEDSPLIAWAKIGGLDPYRGKLTFKFHPTDGICRIWDCTTYTSW